MNKYNIFLSIDAGIYGKMYDDLQGKTDEELNFHYQSVGELEGRIASPFSIPKGLLSIICSGDSVLEIGPFASPLTLGEGVKYFDIMDRNALIERALKVGYSTEKIPDIDYISENGDLSVVEDRNFDFVVSCHCIEHQPDLIEHLNQVSRILKPGGFYLLMVPDKRYCFDHFLAESTIADVVQAHFEKRTSHSLASLIRHHFLTTHNDLARHWLGDHGQTMGVADPGSIERILQEYKLAKGSYIDVHAWQFTPRSFLNVLDQLHNSGLTTLTPKHVFGTPHNSNTFCAALCNG
jgi:SAM-dependent methyltransferase